MATLGRLLDLIGQRSVDLSSIKILVLDAADRMLDMGFLPDHRQNLMFSATYTPVIKKLSETLLRKPAMVEVERRIVAEILSASMSTA